MRVLIVSILFSFGILGQDTFLLESVALEGTEYPQELVLEISGLQLGSPINQQKIDDACQRLQNSGIFQSVEYRYKPGPNKGYALTLIMGDQLNLMMASIDIPGIDEADTWSWIQKKFPSFDRKVPEIPAAQEFISLTLEKHLQEKLQGQKIVTEIESDPKTGQLLISFQPRMLPRIEEMNFTGIQEFTAEELRRILARTLGTRGYLERHFRQALEVNVRRAYEERGRYRVEFPRIDASANLQSARITTMVQEGPQFKLGKAEFSGDDLPVSILQRAAGFKPGSIANWTEIEQKVGEAERRLKRTGFFDAVAHTEKTLHDGQNTLDITISFDRGPLFRFSELQLRGLTARQEAQARKIWKLNPGEPFDYGYANDFLQAFFQSVNSSQFRQFDVNFLRDSSGQPKMGFELVFVP